MFNLFKSSERVVGLDIKQKHIRFVELLRMKREDRITAYGEVTFDKDIFNERDLVEENIFINHLRDIKKQLRTNDFVVSLPSEQVRFIRITLKNRRVSPTRKEMEIFLKSKSIIGVEETVIDFEWAEAGNDSKEYDVLICKNWVVKKYREIFKRLNIKIKKFLIPGGALINSCVPVGSTTSFLVVNVEEKESDFVIYDPLKHASFYQSESANHSIISNLNRVYIEWYDEHKEKIHHVMFSGVRVSDREFLDYVSRETKINLVKANILVNLKLDPEVVPIITKADSYKYAVAVGLALGGY